MTDIVERLRAYAKDQGGWHNIDDTCEEAAAEIERLRKRVERWRAIKEIAEGVGNELVREERARLAEAVEVINGIIDENAIQYAAEISTPVSAKVNRARAFLAKLEGRS